MTTIEREKLRWAWETLGQNQSPDRWGMSAGEVGRIMGISRNTAKNWLDKLIETKDVSSTEVLGRNGQKMILYMALGYEVES